MKIDVFKNTKYKIDTETLLQYIEAKNSFKKTLYIDLGVKIIRLICYCEDFIPHIKKQLPYIICEESSKFDATIILWLQEDIDKIYEVNKLFVSCENNSNKIADFVISNTDINVFVSETDTYFYGVNNLDPEEFAKEGHIFVQMLCKILKTNTTALVHGACFGLNNNGILLCARGQRGKSTLAVSAMLEGFEYVSDDYLILEKNKNELFAHPIYSIITLSPYMYNKLYDKLDGTRFISNNARKDKYIINIANFHNQFRKKYPIKLCMFPEITSEKEPSITECTPQEKGKAITQLVHSTIIQMLDMYDKNTVTKIINMVNNFKFYKINLCSNIYRNVDCLKNFMRGYENDKL